MKTIWKFPFSVTDYPAITMPQDAQILSVQIQNGIPCIWAIVDLEAPTEIRPLRILGTGHPVNPNENINASKFIGTFQLHGGGLVFHLFDFVSGASNPKLRFEGAQPK